MLLDFTRPTSGSLSVNGVPSANAASRAAVGYLAENYRIPPYLSGWQYLQRCAELLNVKRSDAQEQCQRIVESIGMQGREHTKAGTYSNLCLCSQVRQGGKRFIICGPNFPVYSISLLCL